MNFDEKDPDSGARQKRDAWRALEGRPDDGHEDKRREERLVSALRDPATLACRTLLEAAALRAGLQALSDASRCQFVVVRAPSPDWVKSLSNAWPVLVGSEGGGRKARRGPSNLADAIEEGWLVLSRDGTSKGPLAADREIEDAAWNGSSVVGVTHDTRLLPAHLVSNADLTLEVAAPGWPEVAKVVAALSGALPGPHPPADAPPSLTPRLFRLAWRPGRSAADYAGHLLRLSAAEVPTPPEDTLDRLPGLGEATTWGKQLASDLRDYKEGRLPWVDVDRGVLLSGPPGVGKTSFARALAGTCGVPLVRGSWSEWQASRDGHLGDFLAAMRKTFTAARAAAPCILFLDELDSAGDRETFDARHRDYSTQALNGLLECIDGVEDDLPP